MTKSILSLPSIPFIACLFLLSWLAVGKSFKPYIQSVSSIDYFAEWFDYFGLKIFSLEFYMKTVKKECL